MNFQSLPYSADSSLHVVADLDISGTPIYQRPNDYRLRAVDMYELLQGVIERCLATKAPDGTYVVSPIIYDETMFSTDENIPYAPISTWVERTYPNGVLNEVSGYAANLLEWYPHNLVLQAIDDKIWKLNQMGVGGKSLFGNLKDTPPYWEAFNDATAAMGAAQVGYGPVNNQMIHTPARANAGTDIYLAPSDATRIYPEQLIARYKVLQVMRYTQASFVNSNTGTDFQDAYYGGAEMGLRNACTLTQAEMQTAWINAYSSIPGQYLPLTGAALPGSGPWTCSNTLHGGLQRSGGLSWDLCFGQFLWNYFAEVSTSGFQANIYGGYGGIPHNITAYAFWDGTGDKRLWHRTDYEDLLPGKNILHRWTGVGGNVFWSGAVYPYVGDWDSIPGSPMSSNFTISIALQAYRPVVDWRFQFCRHDVPAIWTP